MARLFDTEFDCQIYVPAQGNRMTFRFPRENGPRRAITLKAIDYDQLVEPDFRRLLVAFDTVPQPLATVQV